MDVSIFSTNISFNVLAINAFMDSLSAPTYALLPPAQTIIDQVELLVRHGKRFVDRGHEFLEKSVHHQIIIVFIDQLMFDVAQKSETILLIWSSNLTTSSPVV